VKGKPVVSELMHQNVFLSGTALHTLKLESELDASSSHFREIGWVDGNLRKLNQTFYWMISNGSLELLAVSTNSDFL